ncbi:uncharacterized protein LOC110739886 [Chenopodium quinoa]|uniref:uncharacterized protein LOC110739886 n=1 Tax=Chenopodium quinoa TaxID=63459 RepID=UPI000B76D8BE|nr:uncharacterized protein LOC110739886 [Chenopodium quinoa]
MKKTWNMEQLAKAYIKNVVRLHGVPKDIVSDRDSSMTPFEALYGRKCRSPLCWSDISETIILGPQLIEETTKQVREIQAKIQVAQGRQKSYIDLKRKEEEFQVGDKVLLKVLPMKGVMRFGKKGKLSPKYIGPYEILQRIGKVAYRLALSMDFSKVHDVFHVSQLRSTRKKDVKIVKVLWSNQETEKATWEAENEMRKKCPELFEF